MKNCMKAKWRNAQRLDRTRFNGLVVLIASIRMFGLNRATHREVSRFKNLLSLAPDPLAGNLGPKISALVVVAAKDFPTLGPCLDGILKNSGNTVDKIVLVTPSGDFHKLEKLISDFAISLPIGVVNEDHLISENSRNKLRRAFRERYGWVLQQVLTVQCVMSSDSAGVLVVDADTVLLRPRMLLDFRGRQILTPTFERNKSYYQFLSKLGICDEDPSQTFVPHWMLMQPKIMREALQFTSAGSVDIFIDQIIRLADTENPSSVCVEFEFYAQYLLSKHPEYVCLAKWGNISSLEGLGVRNSNACMILENQEFGSVSMHSYLRY